MKGIVLGLGLGVTGLEIFFRFSTIGPLKVTAIALVGLAILSIGFVKPSKTTVPLVFAVLSGYFVTACLRFPGLFKDSWEWSLEAFLFVSKLSGLFVLAWIFTFFVGGFLWTRFLKTTTTGHSGLA